MRRRSRRATLKVKPLESLRVRRERSQRARRLLRTAAMLLAVLAFGTSLWGAAWWAVRAPHFALRKVRVVGARHVGEDAVRTRAQAQGLLGKNVFLLDLDRIAKEIASEPWIESASLRLELPGTLVIHVKERTAACVVALGSLYLADASGTVFKRATTEEAAELPVVTGPSRDLYRAAPAEAKAQVRQALSVLEAWRAVPSRPRLGELHVRSAQGVTVYTDEGGVGVRVGRVDETLAERLGRFDLVWQELASKSERPRFFYLDNRSRPDRVTIKLAQY